MREMSQDTWGHTLSFMKGADLLSILLVCSEHLQFKIIYKWLCLRYFPVLLLVPAEDNPDYKAFWESEGKDSSITVSMHTPLYILVKPSIFTLLNNCDGKDMYKSRKNIYAEDKKRNSGLQCLGSYFCDVPASVLCTKDDSGSYSTTASIPSDQVKSFIDKNGLENENTGYIRGKLAAV